ncbi:MAG: ribosome silencing factor [Brevundimonas sp.]|uniref:ribosome silencing factor n=1 Tax=Brevundimonas sp. TaxID=1871086 RepID=UPI0040348BAE
MTPSTAYDAQDEAVSNSAHEEDAYVALHDEDGESDAGFDGPRDPLPVGATDLENAILKKLDDDKALDMVLIDLKGKSPMADTMIVASGRSHRHVGALADHLLRTLKDHGLGKVKVEGLPHCDWVLIDAGDVIIHLFRPEVRVFYNIEKIWAVDSAHRTPSAV